MKMRWLYVALSAFGILAAVISVLQFIMAICSMELGRVIFYFVIAALSVELAVLSIHKLTRDKNHTE